MNNSYNKILKNFKKQGFVYLKNFLSDAEIEKINNYRKEIISNLSKNHYIINKNNLIKSELDYKSKEISYIHYNSKIYNIFYHDMIENVVFH